MIEHGIKRAREAISHAEAHAEADRLGLAENLKPLVSPNYHFSLLLKDPHSKHLYLDNELSYQGLPADQVQLTEVTLVAIFTKLRSGNSETDASLTLEDVRRKDQSKLAGLGLTNGELAVVSKLFAPPRQVPA